MSKHRSPPRASRRRPPAAPRHAPRHPPEQAWLARRLCELGLALEQSHFAPHLHALGHELQRVGIALRPRFYLSSGYGCVERTQNVGLLFTDGFHVTRRLARAIGMRVRSGADILRTLRHETGHAFCYAHRLHETPRFRRLFGVKGDFFSSYPDPWRPTPEARARAARGEILRVYAGRHADEDFAICFQTWLADPAGFTKRYGHRPRILEKLAYVAEVVAALGARPVKSDPHALDEPLDALRLTLEEWLDAVRRNADYNLFPKGPVA